MNVFVVRVRRSRARCNDAKSAKIMIMPLTVVGKLHAS